jgi:hypothetical protein
MARFYWQKKARSHLIGIVRYTAYIIKNYRKSVLHVQYVNITSHGQNLRSTAAQAELLAQ